MDKFVDDALQRRISRLIAVLGEPRLLAGDRDVFVGTCLGAVRKQNQDRALVVFAAYPTAPEKSFALAVLADGVGGLARGDEAAVLGLSVFTSRVLRTPRLPIAERLRNAMLDANEAVSGAFGGRAGTTISAGFIDSSGNFLGINVGDSRIYGLSEAREIIQLSRDDTLAGYLGQRREGPDQNHLVQYIGLADGVEPHIVSANIRLQSVLLTSDGIHGTPSDAFALVVRESTSARSLVERLLQFSELMGGRDNGTAIIMPLRTFNQSGDGEQGLNLKFISPSGKLEVWIPILAEDARRIPTALTDATDTNVPAVSKLPIDPAPSIPRGKTPAKSPAKRKHKRPSGQKSGRRRARKSGNRDTTLPLDASDQAILDIKFPRSD